MRAAARGVVEAADETTEVGVVLTGAKAEARAAAKAQTSTEELNLMVDTVFGWEWLPPSSSPLDRREWMNDEGYLRRDDDDEACGAPISFDEKRTEENRRVVVVKRGTFDGRRRYGQTELTVSLT